MQLRKDNLMTRQYQDINTVINRRQLLMQAGAGFGGIALNAMLAQQAGAASKSPVKPLSPLLAKQTHFPATAKSVIFLFMEGGPSHIDMYDMKPHAPAEIRK